MVVSLNSATLRQLQIATPSYDRDGIGVDAEAVDERGAPIDVVDNLAGSLVPLARSQRLQPTAFIANAALFGDLAQAPRFVEAYSWALDSLHRRGARTTLEQLLHGDRR